MVMDWKGTDEETPSWKEPGLADPVLLRKPKPKTPGKGEMW